MRAFEYSRNADHALAVKNNTDDRLKVFLLEIPADNWGQDYAAVVVARDELQAKKLVRMASCDFRAHKEIKVTEIDLNEEKCAFVAETGS